MMTQNLLLIALLWVMFHFLFRDFMLDRLRLKLYTIRDQMLLMVAEGKLSAGDEAYISLRRLLNGSIRFAHEYSFTPFILLFMATRKRSNAVGTISGWRQAIEEIEDSEVRAKLHAFHAEMHWHIFQYIVMTSMLLWVFCVPLFVIVKSNRVSSRVKRIKRCFGPLRVHQLVTWLDNAAFVEMEMA